MPLQVDIRMINARAVDRCLDAHGYDAGPRLHIMHAWREHPGKREFVIYACARGMAIMAEAKMAVAITP